MSAPSFTDRLAYARFLVYFRTGEAPSNAALAKAAGRTGPWVTQIEDKPDPPADYRVHRPMAEFLGVPERWLIHGEGSPPEPEMFARWWAQRTGRPLTLDLPTLGEDAYEPLNLEEPPARRRRSGGR